LNEFSKGTVARLIGYLTKQNIAIDAPNNVHVVLFQQFKEMLNLNLFQLSSEELENIEKYWQLMNELLPEIGVTKK
ncbi:hypothetical protein, partial [Clostridium perfringens]|uniref:hypothetical protein n=1 Tax=Clostridium perfringens TaxID=1502 RepID=UPI0039EB9026